MLQSTGKFLFDDLFARAQKETNLREMNQIQQEKVFKFAAAVFRLLTDSYLSCSTLVMANESVESIDGKLWDSPLEM